MRFTIYEGDLQEVSVKNTMPWIPGEFLLEYVSYMAKSIGEKKWYGILRNGQVIEIPPKDKSKLKRVGELCKFHYDLSSEINSALKKVDTNTDKIMNLIKNRKRTIWQKEERMKGF